MKPFYHIGIMVEDIAAAMTELSGVLGLTWEKVNTIDQGPWAFKVAYSVEGPPYIELTEGKAQPGHPFDTTNGPRIDHIGYWCEDYDKDRKQLIANGAPLEMDNATLGGGVGDPIRAFSFHRLKETGLRIQIQDMRYLPLLKQRLGDRS